MVKGKRWTLLNKNDLPKWSGEGRGKINSINHKKCVGLTLKFENIITKQMCYKKFLLILSLIEHFDVP